MNNSWWYAAAFVVAGLAVGTILGITARRVLDRDGRRPAVRSAARPAAAFGFWLSVAAGLVAAVASVSLETLEPIPTSVLRWLPAAGVAGLIMIGGYVLSSIASAAIGGASQRATGRRQPMLESTSRMAVVAAAAVLALAQLGVDTTILNVLFAAIVFGIAAALAGIAIFGGQHTARNVAAGKAIAAHLSEGDDITIGGYSGRLVELTATHAVIGAESGDTIVVPLSTTDVGATIIRPS